MSFFIWFSSFSIAPKCAGPFLNEEITKEKKYAQKGEIKRRKLQNIASRLAWIGTRVRTKCNKTGKRGNESSRASDIYAEKQLAVIIGKLREQYCRGDVAYNLAGDGADQKGAAFQKCGEEVAYGIYPSHISGENKEEHKGQKQAVVNV